MQNISEGSRFPALAEVRGYWDVLRGQDGLAPFRSAVDPRGLAGALEQAFIVERVAPGVARFRLAGSAVCDLMGMDVRGMPMLSLIEPSDRSRFAAAMEPALMRPGILQMSLEASRGIGRPALSARLLMLPLRQADGAPGLALGCVATEGRIGRCPRRFAIVREHLSVVEGTAQGRTEAPVPFAMAEAPAPFAFLPTRHAHLRVVAPEPADRR